MPKRKVDVSIAVEELLKQLGKALKRARIARGYSQELAAQQVGVHLATIRRIEAGQPEVSAGALAEYSAMLGREDALRALADDDAQTVRLLAKDLPSRAPRMPKRRSP